MHDLLGLNDGWIEKGKEVVVVLNRVSGIVLPIAFFIGLCSPLFDHTKRLLYFPAIIVASLV